MPYVLAAGGLELYPDRRLAMYEGQEVHYSPTEFELLSVLMVHPGRVCSRQDMIQAVWQGAWPEGGYVVDVPRTCAAGCETWNHAACCGPCKASAAQGVPDALPDAVPLISTA